MLVGRLPSRRERWGYYDCARVRNSICLHVASVGEAIAAAPLIKGLLIRHTDTPLVITTNTLTGYQRLKAMQLPVTIVLAPLDLPVVLKRFGQQFNPKLYVLFERELWPNQLRWCRQTQIPMMIANARLSARSLRRYGLINVFLKPLLSAIACVAAQYPEDAERYQQLGVPAEKIHCVGNTKFDIHINDSVLSDAHQWREHNALSRPIWLAASTHAGEEEICLAAHQAILSALPDALLILVPRHPERFDTVAELVKKKGFETARRSHDQHIQTTTQIYLADTMGELLQWFAATDVAFVAGSLLPNIGGHNMIEPAALAKPLLLGPHCENFKTIQQQFVDNRAAHVVENAETLAQACLVLLRNTVLRQQQGERALALVSKHQGTVENLLGLISTLKSQPIV